MKEIFYFWYNRNKAEVRFAAWVGLAEIIFAAVFWFVIWPYMENYKEAAIWEILCAILAGLCVLAGAAVAVVILPEWVSDIRLAIRFKRLFGFYPASTAIGREAMQPRVDTELKRRAIILGDAYAVEEDALHKIVGLGASKSKRDIAMHERDLLKVRKFSRKCKDGFFSRRDTAAQAYFKAPKSFKESLR